MAAIKLSVPYTIVLLDIEGTTTPISFVKDVLFPFAKTNAEGFLLKHPDLPIVSELAELSNELAKEDPQVKTVDLEQLGDSTKTHGLVEALTENVHLWIAQDKKLTALKTLQGMIWEDGYHNGALKGQLFEDVTSAFSKWRNAGVPIYIFSSGSVQAQKLLFANSEYGDCTKYLSGYFDTNIGAKIEPKSYEKIATEIGRHPSDILFVTDVDKEAFAADSAGLLVVISIRDGNAPLSNEAIAKFPQIKSFAELF